MAIDLTGDSAKVFLDWVNTTEEGKAWAEKWTEGADGGTGIILESEGTSKEHVHVQFKKGLGNPLTNSEPSALPEGPAGSRQVARSSISLKNYPFESRRVCVIT